MTTPAPLPTNESILMEFVREQNAISCADGVTINWLLWMLSLLEKANSNNLKINPEWLKSRPTKMLIAGYGVLEDSEPPMFCS